MPSLLDYAPIAATCFAVPQFLPQIRKLAATRDTTGLSWSWAALTSVNNAAWVCYFTLARYPTALIPSSSATLLAGTLAVMLTRQGQARPRPAVLISTWAAMLVAAYSLAGRTGLGTLLTAAFVLQVTPSIWTAYRTPRPTGVSAGTWLLILGELTCWLTFGLHKSDPRLIALGATGVTASALMLTRIHRTSTRRKAAEPGVAKAKRNLRRFRNSPSQPLGPFTLREPPCTPATDPDHIPAHQPSLVPGPGPLDGMQHRHSSSTGWRKMSKLTRR
jgi:uncharacterized protein with PQ loop repeat